MKVKIEIEIAQRLKTEYKKKWEQLVDEYGPVLDGKALYSDITFTPHDYSHHCVNIYNHLFLILHDSFYDWDKSGKNLFVLMVAVLFHDYSLTFSQDEQTRKVHSRLSRDYFTSEARKDGSFLSAYIDNDLIDQIGDVIYAHSNLRLDGQVVNTLKEVVDKYTNEPRVKIINVPALAGLLRFADELDITYKRIEGIKEYEKKIQKSSISHFDKLKLFDTVYMSTETPREIKLYLMSSVDLDSLYNKSLVIEVYDKVQCSLNEIRQEIFDKNEFTTFKFIIREVKIHSTGFGEHNVNTFKNNILKEKYDVIEKIGKCIKDLFGKTDKFVVKEFNGKRNWININWLFESDVVIRLEKDEIKVNFLEFVTETISNHILEWSDNAEDYQLVGLDFYGSIMAGHVGYITNIPSTYCNNVNNGFNIIEKDVKSGTTLIILTDVFETSETLNKYIEKQQMSDVNFEKIIVYSIFQRPTVHSNATVIPIIKNPYVSNVFVLDASCIEDSKCRKTSCDLHYSKKANVT
ncbi:hypothetical protein RI065_08210 [Mycoplasmatota bacterium zrk1]